MDAIVDMDTVDRRLARIGRVPFRAQFHLDASERRYIAARGMTAVLRHAYELIAARLGPAHPAKDGHQTPWGGHPVFRAQHATATCCRTCLERNHNIAAGHELDATQRAYVVAVIGRWITTEWGPTPPPDDPAQHTLF